MENYCKHLETELQSSIVNGVHEKLNSIKANIQNEEMGGEEFSTEIQLNIPNSDHLFEFPRKINIADLRKNKEQFHVNLYETKEIPYLNNMADSKNYVISSNTKNETRKILDIRNFGGLQGLYSHLVLNDRIESLSEKYKVQYETLCSILGQVSGNFHDLEGYLKGEKVIMWTDFEDLALKNPKNITMTKYLLSNKSQSERIRRMRYLGLIC